MFSNTFLDILVILCYEQSEHPAPSYGPWEANFREPLVKKMGSPGYLHRPQIDNLSCQFAEFKLTKNSVNGYLTSSDYCVAHKYYYSSEHGLEI